MTKKKPKRSNVEHGLVRRGLLNQVTAADKPRLLRALKRAFDLENASQADILWMTIRMAADSELRARTPDSLPIGIMRWIQLPDELTDYCENCGLLFSTTPVVGVETGDLVIVLRPSTEAWCPHCHTVGPFNGYVVSPPVNARVFRGAAVAAVPLSWLTTKKPEGAREWDDSIRLQDGPVHLQNVRREQHVIGHGQPT